MLNGYEFIGFDADDTLWINEPYYQEAEQKLSELLSSFLSAKSLSSELFKTETGNLERFGYGAKAFTLSMIETALRVSNQQVSQTVISKILDIGKELIEKPVILLDGVKETVVKLSQEGKKMIIATKGDLLDQERKLENSGIAQYFHHIEIMSDKQDADYTKLLKKLNIAPKDFLMIGNSLKSDVLPVLNIGGQAIHIPYHTTWEHEKVSIEKKERKYSEIKHISELLKN